MLRTVAALLCLLANRALAEEPQGHLGPFGSQGPNSDIDHVDGFLPPEEFFSKYVLQNRPLLFKGAAKLSPAFTKWTDQYFKERAPPRPAGDVFVENNKKENRSQGFKFMHFSDFLDIYNTSNIYMVSDVPSYLIKDLVLPHPLQCQSFLRGGLDTHVVWFSSGGTSSVIHHDTYENINCLYRGRKSLVFLNTTKYEKEVSKIVDVDDGAYSSVDVDKIDLHKRPEFAGLEYQVAHMDTGDCLYIPFLWLHQVRSFENNLAVNIWWPKKKKYNMEKCSKEYSTKITFDKVLFRTNLETVQGDAERVRQAIQLAMKDVKGKVDSEAFLSIVSEGNPKVSGDSDFAEAAKKVFAALDISKDGSLGEDDLNRKMKLPEYRAIAGAIEEYNVAVYKIRQSSKSQPSDADASAKLPKYFKTSTSDEGIFGLKVTWPIPGESGGQEEEEEEGEASLDHLGIDNNSPNDEPPKDEL